MTVVVVVVEVVVVGNKVTVAAVAVQLGSLHFTGHQYHKNAHWPVPVNEEQKDMSWHVFRSEGSVLKRSCF
jgi:hypothetical protein